jgi:hypothetical protein
MIKGVVIMPKEETADQAALQSENKDEPKPISHEMEQWEKIKKIPGIVWFISFVTVIPLIVLLIYCSVKMHAAKRLDEKEQEEKMKQISRKTEATRDNIIVQGARDRIRMYKDLFKRNAKIPEDALAGVPAAVQTVLAQDFARTHEDVVALERQADAHFDEFDRELTGFADVPLTKDAKARMKQIERDAEQEFHDACAQLGEITKAPSK